MKSVTHSTCKCSYILVCEYCKNKFKYFGSKNRAKTRRFCSKECMYKGMSGKNSPVWKNGFFRHDGYHIICVNGQRVLKHRHVMEQHIDRPLKKTEIVHHVDGNPSNNSIDNLVIISSQAKHNNSHATTYRDKKRKQCTVCLKIKPRSDFSINRSNPTKHTDIHDTRCKKCRAEIVYRKRHR